MAQKARRSTLQPSLPQTLLDQIDESSKNNQGKRNGKTRHQLSRKDARKQDREDKKKRKADFFSAPPKANLVKRPAPTEHTESPQRKKTKLSAAEPTRPPAPALPTQVKPALKKTLTSVASANPSKPRTALEKLVSRNDASPLPRSSRSQKEREEDAYIAYLESKLGRGKKTAEDDDGLDVSEKSGSDSEEEESSEAADEEEWGGVGLTPEGDNDSDEAPLLLEPPEGAINGAPTADHTSRYVPPHLRNHDSAHNQPDSEELIKLKRQLNGLLNRMSEQNMAAILDSIEELYRKNRRHDLTSTLTTLIIDGISSHSVLLDSYVVLHAAFVSSMHKIIGLEFAAYFVQHVVSSYEKHYAALKTECLEEDSAQGEGKECSNLIVLLSELYNFQVISSVLVFDIIRDLLSQKLTEFGVELLLKIVRNSGQQLRQDDPSALKDIIGIVQTKIAGQDEKLSSRTRFMIETLTNLKNNKIKRTAGQQHQGGEAVERMKRFLSGLAKKRQVVSHEPLRVSLEDLHAAESKGKWWLVGAAWGGDPLVEHQTSRKVTEKSEETDVSSNALLKLARQQGMNTDIRRSIFIVLMSSDVSPDFNLESGNFGLSYMVWQDYVDACERLAQLNLTEVQQREIIRVILHCCGNEKSYNPYYTLIAQHLCRSSHSYKVTLQFCLWDFLRDLGETTVGGAEVIKNLKEDDGFDTKGITGARMRNVAQAYGWWAAKDCCTLAILKPVDFTTLKPRTTKFLRDLTKYLFIASQVSTPVLGSALPTTRNRGAVEEIFIKATRIEALALGLVYFLSKEVSITDGDGEGLVKWASGVAIDTLRTGMDIAPNL
ncbi:hypothetical protein HWV62_3486 [Athelia sp. TMB]|nr:hypothetical protein HWV62_3486 [Athelia sp. TMB]